MNPAVKSRRGMTLAELMVSLAMVVIMIAMVVSFVVLMTNHTRANGERLTFQQDFAVIKSGVETWMTSVSDVTLEAEGGSAGTIDAPVLKAGENTLQFQNGVLSGDGISLRAESVGAVTFLLEEKSGEYLLFCTVTRADSEDSYTFCVNPRVGEPGGAP